MNTQLVKRLKSFLWRLGAFLFVAAVGWLTQHLGDLQLPIWLQTTLALGLGELTKYLNNK